MIVMPVRVRAIAVTTRPHGGAAPVLEMLSSMPAEV